MTHEVSRGLLDTSVVNDMPALDPSVLPTEISISSLTLAELAAGPHAATDADERARRQARLQWAEATFDPLPFGGSEARAFGVVYAAALAAGRTPRRRTVDLMIAAVAAANDLQLFTRNPQGLAGIESVLTIRAV